MCDFFEYYKEFKLNQRDLLICEDILNTEEFKMDLTPIPIKKKEKQNERKDSEIPH